MSHSQLPSQLGYLEPVLRQLARLPPGELNEDTNIELIESALRVRIAGLSPKDAREVLDGDREALRAWLDQAGMGESPGHYVLGVLLLPGLLRSLLRPATPQPPPRCRIVVDNLKNLRFKQAGTALNIRDGRKLIAISEVDRPTFEHLMRTFDATAMPPREGCVPREDVALGENHGVKYTTVGMEGRPTKTCRYLLNVTGGQVLVEIVHVGGLFDEAKYTGIMKSIRIEA